MNSYLWTKRTLETKGTSEIQLSYFKNKETEMRKILFGLKTEQVPELNSSYTTFRTYILN